MEVTALASRELAWRFLCAGLVALSVVRCISWLGSRRRSLSLPKTEVEVDSGLLLSTSECAVEWGAASLQGWRPEQEDAHVVASLPGAKDHAILCLFDGHGGDLVARTAAQRIVAVVTASPLYKDYLARIATGLLAADDDGRGLLCEVLCAAFLALDDELDVVCAARRDRSGSTAVCAVVTPTFIVVANAGDSRCIVALRGSADGAKPGLIALSEDHKPTNPEEKRRVVADGGFVAMGRVDGVLGLSRALGDFSFKRTRRASPLTQRITAWPDVRSHDRGAEDVALVLACDGVWDVASNAAVARAACAVRKAHKTAADAAVEIVSRSFHAGSRDNITAIVVWIGKPAVDPTSNGRGNPNSPTR